MGYVFTSRSKHFRSRFKVTDPDAQLRVRQLLNHEDIDGVSFVPVHGLKWHVQIRLLGHSCRITLDHDGEGVITAVGLNLNDTLLEQRLSEILWGNRVGQARIAPGGAPLMAPAVLHIKLTNGSVGRSSSGTGESPELSAGRRGERAFREWLEREVPGIEVAWPNEAGEAGTPYDFLLGGQLYVEVKATSNPVSGASFTPAELQLRDSFAERYVIALVLLNEVPSVHLYDGRGQPLAVSEFQRRLTPGVGASPPRTDTHRGQPRGTWAIFRDSRWARERRQYLVAPSLEG